MKRKESDPPLLKQKEINVFLLLVLSIFASETLIMLLLRFLPSFSTWGEAILDSSILSILIFPVIYRFLIKPLKESIADKNAREARYSDLIQNMGEGVVICDGAEKFIFVNAAAERLFGAGKGELIGVGLENYFTEKNFEFIVQQTFERKKGISSFYETEILLKDGTVKNVFITATPQFDNGNFTGTLAIFRDISELKKAEDAIKYERNLLRGLIDNLPDAVYVKDKTFKKIIANPVDLAYMGLHSEADVLGKDDYDVYSKEVADSSFADDSFVFETGKPYLNKEDNFIDNLGKEHWMLNSKVPIRDAAGGIIGLVGIGREITERKKEETRLKLLETVITNATDGVIITQTDDTAIHRHKIIFVNKAFSKITGYSLEEVIGKCPCLLQGAKTDMNEVARVRESLNRNEPCRMEVINYKKNGDEFWSNLAFSPISDNAGKFTHWIAIKRDVTEHKKLEQNYIRAKEVAEAASKAKSEFLANMSHEIRTPLNSVIGFSDLLMKTHLDTTQQQYNSIIFQSANSLLDIINEILDFSKIEAGKLEIDIHKTDILELTYQVSDVICYQAYKKNLELLLNIGQDVPRFIWTDAVRIRQILINLMGNAVKFTSKGEIELKLEVIRKEPDEKATIRFSVRDTGIGIHPENLQKIFEAFSQEDASTTRKYGGTGLGLAISKKMLALMGSELQVMSMPGLGSTFFFELVVKTLHGKPEEWEDMMHYKNTLIVDDNANNRLLLKEMLALQKIEAEEAENGLMAVKMLKRKKYDLILMDYNMPGIDGIETIRQIREDLHLGMDVQPIILLHSSAEDELVNSACNRFGVVQRLVKPIKITQLFEVMSKASHQKQQERTKELLRSSRLATKGESFRVLVVDDNEFNIMLIKKMVGEILPNAVIFEATNGIAAVAHYKNEIPDIIFMDIQMPEMNGHEATKAIRLLEHNKHTPIIALTAGTQAEEKEKCLEAGMDDFVSKPFVSTAIIDMVKKWL